MKHPNLPGLFYDSVTVGERGQVVIPAKARREFGIKPGDKLIVLRGMGKMGIVLVHSDHLTAMFKKMTEHIGQIKQLLSRKG
ncbi:MAG: AbrB/MazE/SpoVT family DNA-binding domain-containing protein [Candidatus Margulisbacteria bacterium]|jgi:AbrB family looped-hinge helix DNA binding protein|nr:AbrB/MazE/SpoVT family DNA-binding domain-containing protein [Candidatus Margulisiibacteriota bacterium]